MHTKEDLREFVTGLEKRVSYLVGQEIEMLRASMGERLANEVLMSVYALGSARAVAVGHVWTGEKLQAIRERFIAALDVDLKSAVELFMTQMVKPR